MRVAIGQCNNILSFFLFLLQVWREIEEEEEEEEESEDLKGSIAFCLQAEHAGTRTYYFSADSQKEQEEWIQVMSEAARVHILATSRYTHTSHIMLTDSHRIWSCIQKQLDKVKNCLKYIFLFLYKI